MTVKELLGMLSCMTAEIFLPLNDQAHQQGHLTIQCNVLPVTGFISYVCLTKPVMGETLH